MTDKEIEVIVKPIFTKMFNSNFSACEYGIECYKKGMEYQGIKELKAEKEFNEEVNKLRNQVFIARGLLEKWHKQHSDKTYTETFYDKLIKATEEFLWSDVCEK